MTKKWMLVLFATKKRATYTNSKNSSGLEKMASDDYFQ
jgi:hypothetical protein